MSGPVKGFGRWPPNTRRRLSSGRHPKPFTEAALHGKWHRTVVVGRRTMLIDLGSWRLARGRASAYLSHDTTTFGQYGRKPNETSAAPKRRASETERTRSISDENAMTILCAAAKVRTFNKVRSHSVSGERVPREQFQAQRICTSRFSPLRLRRGHGNHRPGYREGRPFAGPVLAPVP
jgi:hypothetical protein